MKRVRLNKRSPVERFALVDDADLAIVERHAWTLVDRPKGYPTAVTTIRGKLIAMHRLILGFPKNEVDHINGDRLDNRRANLRSVAHRRNLWNAISKIGTSGFRGVSLTRNKKNWRAQIRHGNRCLHLGTFKTPEEAALAYDRAVRAFRDEFSTLSDGKRRVRRITRHADGSAEWRFQ